MPPLPTFDPARPCQQVHGRGLRYRYIQNGARFAAGGSFVEWEPGHEPPADPEPKAAEPAPVKRGPGRPPKHSRAEETARLIAEAEAAANNRLEGDA